MSQESYIVRCIRRLREYGVGIVLADQCISTIIEIVKSNVFIIIGMLHTGQKDKREMKNVLGLNDIQAKMFELLDVGQGIIRVAGTRFPFPLLIKFPFVKPKNLSESKLDEINAKDPRIKNLLQRVKPVTAIQITNLESPQSIPQYTIDKKPEFKNDRMLEKSKDTLRDIFKRFDIASAARAADLGLSGSAADQIYKYIEQEEFADVIWFNPTGSRGGTSKFHCLSNPKGYEPIAETQPKKSGGTGPMHFFLERYLAKHLPTKGFSELLIEKNINGKRIDLFGKFAGLNIGIEICCTTMKTEYLNFQKDRALCDLVIITTPDRKIKKRLETALYKKIKPTNKLKTCVVCELLNNPEEIINNI
ncbi:hypothetical protein QUF70_03865 [Desulfobacterales bacterium HSG17]|nr:hypothetical protein [Desulfobacterales bacterium HSG17]